MQGFAGLRLLATLRLLRVYSFACAPPLAAVARGAAKGRPKLPVWASNVDWVASTTLRDIGRSPSLWDLVLSGQLGELYARRTATVRRE